MIDTVFSRFGVRVAIKLNNRKILAGIAESIGQSDKIVDITVAIDKLDKIGLDGVNAELADKGLPQDAIDKLQPIIKLTGSNSEKLDTIATVLAGSETGLKGVEECRFILDGATRLGLKNQLELDLTLARGLNYYTGAIFEVKALDVEIGSISGGGRYDNLTGISLTRARSAGPSQSLSVHARCRVCRTCGPAIWRRPSMTSARAP